MRAGTGEHLDALIKACNIEDHTYIELEDEEDEEIPEVLTASEMLGRKELK